MIGNALEKDAYGRPPGLLRKTENGEEYTPLLLLKYLLIPLFNKIFAYHPKNLKNWFEVTVH